MANEKHNINFYVTQEVNGFCLETSIFDNYMKLLSKRIIDTENKITRSALIEMGWTAPKKETNDKRSSRFFN